MSTDDTPDMRDVARCLVLVENPRIEDWWTDPSGLARQKGRIQVQIVVLRYAKWVEDGKDTKARVMVSLPFGYRTWLPAGKVKRWWKQEGSPPVGEVLTGWFYPDEIEKCVEDQPVHQHTDEDCSWESHGVRSYQIDGHIFPNRITAVRYLRKWGYTLMGAYEYVEELEKNEGVHREDHGEA